METLREIKKRKRKTRRKRRRRMRWRWRRRRRRICRRSDENRRSLCINLRIPGQIKVILPVRGKYNAFA
jgi:hypothetical protein